VLALWSLHLAISFGSPATSSWLGMNFARATVFAAPPPLITTMVRDHQLAPLAETRPFAPLSAVHVAPNHVGAKALSQVSKANGQPNYNNRAYIGLSRRWLVQDEHFVADAPSRYLRQVGRAVRMWFLPTDQYFGIQQVQHGSVGSYVDAYDHVVLLQAKRDPTAIGSDVFFRVGPTPSELSITAIVEWIAAILGFPVLVALWWRRRHGLATGVLLMGLMALAWFATASLVENAENNRFRFEVGTIPLILAAAALSAALRALRHQRPSSTVAAQPTVEPPTLAIGSVS